MYRLGPGGTIIVLMICTNLHPQLPKAMEVLMELLGSGGKSASALAFLANCVKDHGAIPASVKLFKMVW